MATFRITETFDLTNRGFALVGHLIDDGTVSSGDNVRIKIADRTCNVEILQLGMCNKNNEGESMLSFVISFEDKEKLIGLDLSGVKSILTHPRIPDSPMSPMISTPKIHQLNPPSLSI